MDKATIAARKRMKAQRTPRGQLSPFEPRGMGRRNKPHETFPTATCEFVIGGKKVATKRQRKDKSWYKLMIVVGGERCPASAVVGRRCLGHVGAEWEPTPGE